MAKNNKPILSVLVDEEKKERFSALAKEHNYSMGWLLNQAIDKMLEAGTIHIYRDSIASASTNIAPSADIEELVRSYVDKAIAPLSNDLASLQSQIINRDNWDDLKADVADLRSRLAELKTDNDMTAASIKRLIAEAISKALIGTHTDFDPAAIQVYIDRQIEALRAEITAIGAKPASIATTGNPSQKAKAATTAQNNQSTPGAEKQKWARRLQANPELRAAIEEGLDQNLTGKPLVDWLFSKGFGSNENTKPFDSSVPARMRGAIEHLNSLENGAPINE